MDEESNVLAMYNEIIGVQKSWNKRHQLPETATLSDLVKAHNRLMTDVGATVLSFTRDLAHESGQHMVAITDLADEIDDQEQGGSTQFTAEDADRFMRVISYAEMVLDMSLQQPLEMEKRNVLEALKIDAVACKATIEENTLEDEPEGGEDEEGDEEEDPDATPQLPEASQP